MYCHKCGLALESTDEFCSNCGERNRTKIDTSVDNITKRHPDGEFFDSIDNGAQVLVEEKTKTTKSIEKKFDNKSNIFFGIIFIILGYLFYTSVIPDILYGESPEINTNNQKNAEIINISSSNVITDEEKKIQICEQVASDYYQTHTYNGHDIFDCDNMAQDVWNILETKGINSEIWIGNVDRIGPVTLKDCNHAWVMAEISPNGWLAIECTGGYVVYDNEQYYRGFSFKNPKNYQRFLDLYANWEYQCQDYENYRLYYNNLVDVYNDVDYYEQVNMQSGLAVAKNTLDEKEKIYLKTDAELNTLLEYG